LAELVTLGADVLPTYADSIGKAVQSQTPLDESLSWSVPNEFVLTRLHARYDKDSLGEDLVFAEAPAIVGGREFMQSDGKLEQGAVEQPGGMNNFQARYIIRHPWTGKIECQDPRRGIWGGPPEGGGNQPTVARQLAFEARDASLATFVTAEAGAQIGVTAIEPPAPTPDAAKPDEPAAKPDEGAKPNEKADAKSNAGKGGCTCEVDSSTQGFGWALLGLLGLGMMRRRTRSTTSC
jgi:MYXO-CTERM domain-containing protein